jgi:hypothetical protein
MVCRPSFLGVIAASAVCHTLGLTSHTLQSQEGGWFSCFFWYWFARLTVKIQHPKRWDIGVRNSTLFLAFIAVQNHLERKCGQDIQNEKGI